MKCSLIVVIAALLQAAMASLNTENLATIYRNLKPNKVLKVTDKNYENIFNGQRDYHLVLYLYSTAPQINCLLCNEFRPHYELVANSWYQDHPEGLEDGADVYFLSSEFLESKTLFSALELNNIPKVYHFPPSKSSKPNAFVKEYDEYQFLQGDHSKLLADYLSHATGHTFNIHVPANYTRIIINAIITFALVLLARKFSHHVRGILSSRLLWSSVVFIAILLFTSGYMFVQIKGVPFVNEQPTGKVDYIAGGQQMQLGAETQIVSFIYGILAIATVFLIIKAPSVANPQANFLVVVILSAVVFVAYSAFILVFRMKGMGYPYHLLTFS